MIHKKSLIFLNLLVYENIKFLVYLGFTKQKIKQKNALFFS